MERYRKYITNQKGIIQKDLISGLFFLAISVFVIEQMSRLSIWTSKGPKEGFFPLLLGVIIAIMSIFLVLSGLLGSSISGNAKNDVAITRKRRVLLYVASLFAYSILLRSFGFILSSFLLLFVILRFAETQSWRSTILITVVSVVVSYIAFYMFLGVPLPRGLIYR